MKQFACQKKFGLGFLVNFLIEEKINEPRERSDMIVKEVLGALISASFSSALEENEEVLSEDDYEEMRSMVSKK